LKNNTGDDGKPLEIKKINNSKTGHVFCKRYYGEMMGYIAYVYFNEGTKATLTEEYQETELKNVSWYYPFQGNSGKNKANILEIGPNKVSAVILKYGWENNCDHINRIGTKSLVTS